MLAAAELPVPAAADQALVELRATKAARARPARGARRVTTLPAARPITGGPTVLPVLRSTTRAGTRWLRVRLPGRPNGRTGWITADRTRRTHTVWRLVVRTRARQVVVHRRGQVVRRFSAVVGKPSTPTPHGSFFVEESVRMVPGSVGAPFALALSARSNVLQEFAGGPGQIAIHGVGGIGGTPGTAASHGCVRLSDAAIRWLAARMAPGAPVDVVG